MGWLAENLLRRRRTGQREAVGPEEQRVGQAAVADEDLISCGVDSISHWLSGWPKKSPNFLFTTKMVLPKSLKSMNSGSEIWGAPANMEKEHCSSEADRQTNRRTHGLTRKLP